jgi:hypothetical protein
MPDVIELEEDEQTGQARCVCTAFGEVTGPGRARCYNPSTPGSVYCGYCSTRRCHDRTIFGMTR